MNMNKVSNEIYLDYSDVLIKPRYSTIKSRADIDLVCSYTFKNSQAKVTGVPIIISNMDTTGTFEMAAATEGYFDTYTCFHKHYTLDDYKKA